MARKFWNEEDYTQGSNKTNYLRDYSLKNGLTKGLRKVEVDRLDELLRELDLTRAIEYFETLPDNFKKSFKVGYRQHVKREKSEGRGKQIEIDRFVSGQLEVVLESMNRCSPNELEKYVEGDSELDEGDVTSDRNALISGLLSAFGAYMRKNEFDDTESALRSFIKHSEA